MSDQPAINQMSDGQIVRGSYLLLRKQIATSRGGKAYGALRLGDRGGEMEAKLWERAEELLAEPRVGMVVAISGRVEAFQGRPQLVLASIAVDPLASPADFLPASPVPLAELWAAVDAARAKVKNKHLRRLLKTFFDEPAFRRVFELAPAAKAAHHAYAAGLLEHTAGVAGLAVAVAGRYPHLDAGLLICGALLHDVGKTRELSLGPPIDYTDEGRLEGHIAIGARLLDERLAKLPDFPAPAAAMIRHMILSHHGDYQFGSPRRPKTAEALALHMIDDLDAKMAMLRAAAAEEPETGHWSRYHRLLERVVYAGPPVWDQPDQPVKTEAKAADSAVMPGLFDMGEQS
ncbi:3'-5' exoribonuclease YhaM family protein [Desulfarculus baarsii]